MRPSLVDVPRVFSASGLLFRSFERGDGPALYSAIDRSRDQLRPWIPWADQHARLDDSEAFAREASGRFTLREDLTYGVWDDAGALLGGAGLHRFDFDVGRFEIGYWVRTDRHRRGIGTRATQAMLVLAFAHLRAARVEVRVDALNDVSARIPRALGLIHEGTLRRDSLAPNGMHRDTMVFAMLADEFERAAWAADVSLDLRTAT